MFKKKPKRSDLTPKGVSHTVVPIEFNNALNPKAPLWDAKMMENNVSSEKVIYLTQNT